jgi:hypothetical protein
VRANIRMDGTTFIYTLGSVKGHARLLVTDVPLTAHRALIGTHRSTIAFRQELRLTYRFFTRCVPALRLTARRGVGA